MCHLSAGLLLSFNQYNTIQQTLATPARVKQHRTAVRLREVWFRRFAPNVMICIPTGIHFELFHRVRCSYALWPKLSTDVIRITSPSPDHKKNIKQYPVLGSVGVSSPRACDNIARSKTNTPGTRICCCAVVPVFGLMSESQPAGWKPECVCFCKYSVVRTFWSVLTTLIIIERNTFRGKVWTDVSLRLGFVILQLSLE